MKKLLFVFLFVFFAAKLFATTQVPDYLLVDKDTIALHCNPLEVYIKDHPIPIPPEGITGSSSNWRGYIAYFKFVGDQLVVENICRGNYKEDENGKTIYYLSSIYKDVFGDVKDFPGDFYTGLLICPYGESLQSSNMGYSSVYEYYKLFEIKSGVKIKSKDLLGDEYFKFKRDYYNYYKTTEEYKEKAKKFKEMMDESDKIVNERIPAEYRDKPSKKENKYLKQKEAEFKAEKRLDSFMFLFLEDYIKTIDIPNKQ